MAALCWGCEMGMTPVGVPSSSLPLDPLGACWECHAFTCKAHARRDQNAGKWLCYSCVASALSVSAGVDDEDLVQTRFSDSDDFENRFGELAEASRERRREVRDDEYILQALVERAGTGREIRRDLLGDAVGVAMFLVTAPPREYGQGPIEPSPDELLSGRLSTLIPETRHG